MATYDLAISHWIARCASRTGSSTPSRPNATSAAPRARRDPAAGRSRRRAETVYWEDLRRNRENGWALFGLLQALRAQNKMAEATLTEARFKAAWARADVTLTSSRFGR